MASAFGGTLSALEVSKIVHLIIKTFVRFNKADVEFSKYHAKFEELDTYLKLNLDGSQQPLHLVELNDAIRSFIENIKGKLDPFRAEMEKCRGLRKDEEHKRWALVGRFRWLLKLRRRAIALTQELDERIRFLQVQLGLRCGLNDMSRNLSKSTESQLRLIRDLSERQTTEILAKIAAFEVTYNCQTQEVCEILTEENKNQATWLKRFRMLFHPQDAVERSENDIDQLRAEFKSASNGSIEGYLNEAHLTTEIAEEGSWNGEAIDLGDIQRILAQTRMSSECGESSSEMGFTHPAEVDVIQSADPDLHCSISVSSDDEDGTGSINLVPDWPDDVFSDKITNHMSLQTWREDVLPIVREEAIILSWLQDWPDNLISVFTEEPRRSGLAFHICLRQNSALPTLVYSA